MSNNPKPPTEGVNNSGSSNRDQNPIQNTANDLIVQTQPRAFGATSYSDQRRDEINDEKQYPPSQAADGRGATYRPAYGPADFDRTPYTDTIIVIHHSPKGIRASFQMRTRIFLFMILALIFLFSLPSFGDKLFALIKLALTGN